MKPYNPFVLASALGLLLSACATAPEPSEDLVSQAAWPEGAAVCFYEHIDFQGASFCTDAGRHWVDASWNDRISSLKVKDGFRVELSEDIDFGGRLLELTRDAPAFPENFNDLTSSFKVSQTDGVGAGDDDRIDEKLAAQCTPEVELEIEDLNSEGATKLLNTYPEVIVKLLAPLVCRTLYERAEEAHAPQTIVFHIVNEPGGEPAWAEPGLPVAHLYINTDPIQKISGDAVLREFQGLTAHELTHLYQNYGAGASSTLTEGIANYVRFQNGFIPPKAKPDKRGNWDSDHRTTAFFFIWVEQKTPGFVRKLNLAIAEDDFSAEAVFKDLTGKTPDQLWNDYRNDNPEGNG